MNSPNPPSTLSTLSSFSLRLFSILLLAGWVLPLLPARAADESPDPKTFPPPRRALVPKLRGPVTIDGNLNEPVWTNAAVLSPFSQNDGSGSEREKTTVRIWYDDTALYLGWTCVDSDIQATFTARDSKFWEEEVVEFFVTPEKLDRYFELQWNPLGGVFDAIIDNKVDQHGVSTNFTGDWSFTAKGMKSGVKVRGTVGKSDDKDEMWQVEVMLPFADLGERSPKSKAIWRANFYRFNRAKEHPEELLSWSPTRLPGFHQPARFGYLEFGE